MREARAGSLTSLFVFPSEEVLNQPFEIRSLIRRGARALVALSVGLGPHEYEKLVAPTHGAHGGSLLFPFSRSILSLSFTSVSCRNSSAAAFSEVVNGPVGGRRRPRRRSRRERTRFMQGASRAYGSV
jgi:hypothetical protein